MKDLLAEDLLLASPSGFSVLAVGVPVVAHGVEPPHGRCLAGAPLAENRNGQGCLRFGVAKDVEQRRQLHGHAQLVGAGLVRRQRAVAEHGHQGRLARKLFVLSGRRLVFLFCHRLPFLA